MINIEDTQVFVMNMTKFSSRDVENVYSTNGFTSLEEIFVIFMTKNAFYFYLIDSQYILHNRNWHFHAMHDIIYP